MSDSSTARDWFAIQRYPHGVTRITERFAVPLASCNIWLIAGAERDLLVDAGTGVMPLAPLVASLTPRPVTLLLTHSHYDHLGGAHEFAERLGHVAEAHHFAEGGRINTLAEGWFDNSAFRLPPFDGFDATTQPIRAAPLTQTVGEGSILDLGDRRLIVLHLPGHSPGLVGLFEPATGLVFTSDALYDGTMFCDLPGSDARAFRESQQRLATLLASTAHPGHFESFDQARLRALTEHG